MYSEDEIFKCIIWKETMSPMEIADLDLRRVKRIKLSEIIMMWNGNNISA